MTLGKKIQIIRKHRNMTQQELGLQIGYPASSAGIRICQYENGSRIPSLKTRYKIALALKISPVALSGPKEQTPLDYMEAIFWMEEEAYLDPRFVDWMSAWRQMAELYRKGKISKEEYLEWKLRFPCY